MVGYLCLSHLYRIYVMPSSPAGTNLPVKQAHQPLYRIYFFFASAIIILCAFHGTSALKILFIITISYAIGQYTGGSMWNPILSWTFNLAILFLNEWYHGYEFASLLGPSFAWMVSGILGYIWINIDMWQSHCQGWLQWSTTKMAYSIQLCDATSRLLQYGLLLASEETTGPIWGVYCTILICICLRNES